jgi:hypothetical protein
MNGIATIISDSAMIQIMDYRYSEVHKVVTQPQTEVSAIYPDGSFIVYGQPGEYKWNVITDKIK